MIAVSVEIISHPVRVNLDGDGFAPHVAGRRLDLSQDVHTGSEGLRKFQIPGVLIRGDQPAGFQMQIRFRLHLPITHRGKGIELSRLIPRCILKYDLFRLPADWSSCRHSSIPESSLRQIRVDNPSGSGIQVFGSHSFQKRLTPGDHGRFFIELHPPFPRLTVVPLRGIDCKQRLVMQVLSPVSLSSFSILSFVE